jgi:hypothetical protein
VSRLLSMAHGETTTDDQLEHHGLDPWVQWVSVHTGRDSAAHGVLHLGDTPAKLGSRQLWEVLDAQGISSGVWGAMNATRGQAEDCRFFLPDPWTFSEPAYPADLDDLLALPRYYARNFLDVSMSLFIGGTLRLSRYVLRSGAVLRLLACVPLALRGVLGNGVNNAVLFSLFDLFQAVLFDARRRREQPRFSLVFLNSIAHLQHHRWSEGERLDRSLRFGLRAIDRALGTLFAGLAPGEAVLVMNALTQRNVSAEGPLVAYRQLSPERFVQAAGLEVARVEALMTSDAHLFFASEAARDRAVEVLAAVRVHGKPLFQAQADADCATKAFYQVVFWDPLPADTMVQIGGRAIRFFEHFEVLVHRTGAHVPEGQWYAEGISLPARLYNHEAWGELLRHFGVVPPVEVAGVAAVSV